MELTEWQGWWPIISAAVVMAAGGVAWLRREFTKRGETAQERQQARDEKVSERASDLIDQYQEAIRAQREEILEVKKQCQIDLADLRARANEMERSYLHKIAVLERQVEALLKRRPA